MIEHNFLTEQTKDYLNLYFKDKNHNDFIKNQKDKMKKSSHFFFCLPQSKESRKQEQFKKLYEFDGGGKEFEDVEKQDIANLHYPEIENIDYSEYSDEQLFKNDLFAKEYKDGILLVSNYKTGFSKMLQPAFVIAPCDEKNEVYNKTIISMYKTRENFRNLGQVNWKDIKFNEQVVLYFAFPNFSKNKVFKIVLKNDAINKLVNHFRNSPDIEKNNETTLFFRDKAEPIFFLSSLKDKKLYEEYFNHVKNKDVFLKYGYESAVIRLHNIVAHLDDFFSKSKIKEDFYKSFKERTDNKTEEELKQIYLKEVYPYEEHFEPYFVYQEHSKNIQKAYYKNVFLKYIILRFSPNIKYNTLLNGTIISTEYKSEADCLLFWNKINLFELFFNLFNKNNSRLALNPEGIVNDLDKFSDSFTLETDSRPPVTKKEFEEIVEETEFEKRQYDFKDKHILQEAMDSDTGYLMPYDGAFELLDDPLFKFIRFREYEDLISIVISDKNERCLVEVFDKNKVDFKYMLWNDLKQSQYHSEECVDDIYTKLATCIRDAKILIERDSTMRFNGRRTPSGCNTNSTYEIYFPRTRYRRNPNKEQLRKERDFFNESRKFSGTRRQHIRRLVAGHRADKKQLLLAKQMDFYVPEGHTYVKAATWGDNMTKREVRYRNTALNGIFYYDKREMSEAQKINQLGGAGFEEYSQKYLQKLGYEVKHKSNYDGGIDIRAVKILDNMEPENLLVQCKHWKSPVSPGAMRDFITACNIEESKNKKFMFITSSRFSPGAIELADKFNIESVDFDHLTTNNKKG